LHQHIAPSLPVSNNHLVSSPSYAEVPDALRLPQRFVSFFLAYSSVWMSKSRSATPKPITFPSINISQSTESTTSRPRPHENTPSADYFEGREQRLASRPASPRSFQCPPPEDASSALSRWAEPSADQPMAKRLRRESSQRHRSSASPSSDSQDGMADTETDTSRYQQSEAPQPPVKPQPKKKRTRTLTTPHQSAVLHALLAQV
jgi:hypothetical protein